MHNVHLTEIVHRFKLVLSLYYSSIINKSSALAQPMCDIWFP